MTANTEETLKKAVDKINDLINTDLGPLVEDKKDRLREKVRVYHHHKTLRSVNRSFLYSENGRKKNCPLDWSQSETSMSERRSWDQVGCLSNISNKRLVLVFRSKAKALVSMRVKLGVNQMSRCTSI